VKTLISGANGLVGSALLTFLKQKNHQIVRLVRTSAQSSDEISWDPQATSFDSHRIQGFDAVIHLAGESIGEGRWTAEKKRRIHDSRVQGTRILSEAIANLPDPPKVFITASAQGYYGDRAADVLLEDEPAGNDFLARVCVEWEAATQPAKSRGIRVLHLRSGLILSKNGGALPRMLVPFRFGVGGKIGTGRQYWSWIAIDDHVRVIDFLLNSDSLSGPINLCTPNAVTNAEFTQALGKVLCRPTIFPLPAAVARTILGEMADALLLSSIRMQPAQLLNHGFQFLYPDLEEALYHE
jgi:uncharacterized protein